MKLIRFTGISLGIHILALVLIVLGANGFFNLEGAANFVQVSEYSKSSDTNSYKPFYLGDDDIQKKMKPIIITNKEELQKENDDNAGNGSGADYGNYLPSYEVEELPVAETPISPVYPEEARRNGVEGKVLLLIYIDEQGNIKKAEIQKSPSSLLSDSALKALSSVKFRPAKIGGIARAVCMQLTLRFKLE